MGDRNATMYNNYVRLQQAEQQKQEQKQQAQSQQIPCVGGVEGAKSYPIPNGGSTIVMDNADPIFYMVQVDQQGMRAIKAFSFQEIELKQANTVDTSQFATKEDLQAILKQLEEIKGGLANGESTNGTNAKRSK